MNLEQKIEAVLFWKNESVSRKKLGDILGVNQQEINEAITKLKENLSGRGIILMEKPARTTVQSGGEDEIILGTPPELSKLFEDLQKEELNKELSKASLETISIVLYKNGVSRAEIDWIRGVNSSFTLRALSARGLVEKLSDPKDNRRYIYKPTFELLSFMGVKSVEELHDYNEVKNSIDMGVENLIKDSQDLSQA